jgi:phenylalanine-4-hydroxylase
MSALKEDVKKIPYSIDAMDYSFDITKPQPQLFVTPDFKHLSTVLNEFASQMALTTGGIDGIMKAIDSGNTGTIEYASGLQVSGTFTDVIVHSGRAVYVKTSGPTTLNYKNKMIENHSKDHHKDGFGSPVGKIKGTLKPVRLLSNSDLKELGIEKGKSASFSFESGIKVKGTLTNLIRKEGKLILLTFSDCHVSHFDKTLFEPSWGVYDMAVGEKITSTYSGPADPEGFGLSYKAPEEKTHQINYDQSALELHKLYKEIREIRESGSNLDSLEELWHTLLETSPDDWLLPVEIVEICNKNSLKLNLKKDVETKLNKLSHEHPNLNNLISNGLKLSVG